MDGRGCERGKAFLDGLFKPSFLHPFTQGPEQHGHGIPHAFRVPSVAVGNTGSRVPLEGVRQLPVYPRVPHGTLEGMPEGMERLLRRIDSDADCVSPPPFRERRGQGVRL